MINKQFDIIEKTDIDDIVSNSVSEGKKLDFKEKLPSNSDGEKTEFLADVSSFANASGGDIIFGIREKRDENGKTTGTSDAAEGLEITNTDQEVLRLENMIRDGIAPRITGLQIKAIKGFPKGPVIVIRISKSWIPPHMITFKGNSRFYSRNNAGKYPIDVGEIRTAFLMSETLPDRIRQFRKERIAKIVADETPVQLDPNPKLVLHLLPISVLEPGNRIDVTPLVQQTGKLSPIHALEWSCRYNFDGFLTYSSRGGTPTSPTYLQVFRTGAIEAVEASIVSEKPVGKVIPSVLFEREILSALKRFLQIIREFRFEPPIFIMLSLVGINGYRMGVDPTRYLYYPQDFIDRDVLLIPETIVQDFECKVEEILHPIFDAVWQAAGWDRSQNYDVNGKWVGN